MTEMTGTGRGARLHRLPVLLFLLVVLVASVLLSDSLSYDALARNRDALLAFRDAHYGLTVIAFATAYILIVAFSLPGATIATLTGGFLFGTLPGTLINVVAATLGATAIFLAARWGMGEALAQRMNAASGRIKRVKQGIDDNQWEMLFLIRLVPVVPFFVANILPALVGVTLARYVITTALGIVPGALVYTSAGAGLGEVFAQGETPDLGIIFAPQILLPILGLCALAALPLVVKSLRGGRKL